MTNTHEFALFCKELTPAASIATVGTTLTIREPELVRRVKQVLRLTPSEQCVLFNDTYHAQVVIESINKELVCRVHTIADNRKLIPEITCLIPLLKREALADALYAATELGATEVQLIVTEKSQKQWQSHDYDRYKRVMIAAAEQSKNFSLPILHHPELLSDSIGKLTTNTRIFFDPQGSQLRLVLESLQQKQPQNLVLLMGSEGDLTDSEKELLRQNNFIFCALTPTVLRAQQALTVGLGAIRSYLR